jgi:hypothetical protein
MFKKVYRLRLTKPKRPTLLFGITNIPTLQYLRPVCVGNISLIRSFKRIEGGEANLNVISKTGTCSWEVNNRCCWESWLSRLYNHGRCGEVHDECDHLPNRVRYRYRCPLNRRHCAHPYGTICRPVQRGEKYSWLFSSNSM